MARVTSTGGMRYGTIDAYRGGEDMGSRVLLPVLHEEGSITRGGTPAYVHDTGAMTNVLLSPQLQSRR